MEDLEREILLTRIKHLRAKLDRAVQQRNGVMTSYHALLKVPFKERNEILKDFDADLDKLSEPGQT